MGCNHPNLLVSLPLVDLQFLQASPFSLRIGLSKTAIPLPYYGSFDHNNFETFPLIPGNV